MREGTVGTVKEVPVSYNGHHLGMLKVVERSDWRNRSREPTPLDFELAKVALSAQAVYEALERHPRRPDGRDEDEPWVMTVCRVVCDVAEKSHAREFEEDVMRQYVDTYGMGQVIAMFGGDPARIYEQIQRFREGEERA